MAKKYIYEVLSHDHIEDLITKINSDEYSEWRLIGTIQEHGFTKLILEKEIDN